MSQKQIIIYIACVMFGVFFIPIYFGHSANISISPSSQQNLQCGSGYDFDILLSTSGENVVASDIKFFLQGFSLSGITTLTGFNHINYLGTGVSRKGTNIGRTYYYLNMYQSSFANFLTGNNIPIARITVAPTLGNANGSIVFYDLSANDEDSNIAVGIEHGTQGFPIRYTDFLSSATNGGYTFSGCVTISTGCTGPCCGGGCGSPVLKKDNCKLPSTLPGANEEGIDYSFGYYDQTCEAGTGHEMIKSCPVESTNFSQEMTDAFQFSYGLDITTMCPIEKARLNGYILRKELAKMMTNFTIRVMGIYPNLNKTGCDIYDDISYETRETKFYIKTICQLDMMGLNEGGIVPKRSFDPNQYVDRAQFGTILSRLVFGGKYNVTGNVIDNPNKDYRFRDHLNALKLYGIMNNISDPYMLELRGYAFIMLQRIYDGGLVEKYRLFASAKNGSNILLNN